MKRNYFLLLCLLLSYTSIAQNIKYQTFIYTSEDLGEEISQKYSESTNAISRGYMGNLLDASVGAGKGIASGYVTSFIDMGVNAVGSLVTKNSRQKKEWEESIKKENIFETKISTVSEVNDFYQDISFDGAMDPKGMRFDGIGCLRKDGKDTVFYISCHVDRSKLHRIVNHSKFELVLDTFILSPTHSHLPNSPYNIPFSFEERKNFILAMNIKLISSWMNEIVLLQKDQILGEFSITIPIKPENLDARGYFRYVRKEDEPGFHKIAGESFIVPRSYMGYRDDTDEYKDCWGTGEYKLAITLKETCEITDEYRENWKSDYKRRKKMQPDTSFVASTWQTISNQRWDEQAKSWVITTLRAPAGIIGNDLLNELGLKSEGAAGAGQGAAGAGQGATRAGQGAAGQDKELRGQDKELREQEDNNSKFRVQPPKKNCDIAQL